jgi:hypothetical protein
MEDVSYLVYPKTPVSLRIEMNSPSNQSQNQTMERRLHFGPYYYPGCSLGVKGPKAVRR